MNKKKSNKNQNRKNDGNGMLKKLTDKIQEYDKSSLISFITGCVFILLSIIQLILLISTPLARTFDHFSLVLVDFIIAAVCFVYVLYRQGKLTAFVQIGEPKQDADEADTSHSGNRSEHSATSRIVIPSAGIGNSPRPVRSSTERKKRPSQSAAKNENLFSPRHRYSDASTQQRRSPALHAAKRHTGKKTTAKAPGDNTIRQYE